MATPVMLALTILAWVVKERIFASATLEQCQLDCGGSTTSDLVAQAAIGGGSWSVWDTQRLIGPTEPTLELNVTYPFNSSCCAMCDGVYARNLSVGISDYAEKATLECRDGCNIAALRCQPGYLCSKGVMSECAPGTYRNTSYDMITSCVECPRGTFRSRTKGRGIADCDLCPVNTYQNTTGAKAETDCIRCPDGLIAELEGSAECSCVTDDSCLSEWQNFQRDSTPYVGRH